MTIIMGLLFILQLCIISVGPIYAGQRFSLATTKASNKAATTALLEVVKRKETSSDDILNLIDKGADVNAKNKNGYTPLILAAMYGHRDICLALIDKGADVNAIDNYGGTPLIWAANNGLTDVCLAFIDKGADVNAKDQSGYTPLILAAMYGHRDVCILLLRHMLLKQLLDADSEDGDLATRKTRMRCAILTLKNTTMNKDLIPLIVKSKPLMHDYTACRYDTYCCRPRLNEYHHAITRDQLCNLLGQGTIDALKAAIQHACDTCDDDYTTLKNFLNSIAFDEFFDELFLRYIHLKPTTGE